MEPNKKVKINWEFEKSCHTQVDEPNFFFIADDVYCVYDCTTLRELPSVLGVFIFYFLHWVISYRKNLPME